MFLPRASNDFDRGINQLLVIAMLMLALSLIQTCTPPAVLPVGGI